MLNLPKAHCPEVEKSLGLRTNRPVKLLVMRLKKEMTLITEYQSLSNSIGSNSLFSTKLMEDKIELSAGTGIQ